MTKEIYYSLRDKNGNKRTKPVGTVANLKLGNRETSFLQSYLDLLVNTDIISKETKVYIGDKFITKRGVTDYLNESLSEGETPKNFNTVASKIGYDQTKLSSIFGADMVTKVLTKKADLDEYSVILVSEIQKRGGGKGVAEELVIDLPQDSVCSELDDDSFDALYTFITPYFRAQMLSRLRELYSINKNCMGYFNYLMFTPETMLSNEDILRRKKLELGMGRITEGEYEEYMGYSDKYIEDLGVD